MNTGTRRTAGPLGYLNRKLLKTIPKDPRVKHAPCPKLTRPPLRIIVENQCIIVGGQHQPPQPHLAQTPVDGAFRIAFASPHKRLCRLAFWEMSTSCNFFVRKHLGVAGQGSEKTKKTQSHRQWVFDRHDSEAQSVSKRNSGLTWPGPKAVLPGSRDESSAPRSPQAPSAPVP